MEIWFKILPCKLTNYLYDCLVCASDCSIKNCGDKNDSTHNRDCVEAQTSIFGSEGMKTAAIYGCFPYSTRKLKALYSVSCRNSHAHRQAKSKAASRAIWP